ncbi:Dynein heavy chain [Phytophthora cinnamomi]|uniref:Dynein heavy chain n=1 Tax=Phytophthora cinnamomi TaxID=4785 RepID=UPI003559F2E5|nr:Dynein heavy chain [Phytophthora cinnamomi]
MLEAGAKRTKIYDYLLEHNQNGIQSDVDNLVRTHSSAESSANDGDETSAEVAQFMAEDPRNLATVAATSTGASGVTSLASAHMRELYERFPEMLLVESSYKTNRHNYQLLTMMVMNEFGEGSPVQHSICEANGDWHLERAIAHFKRMYPDKTRLLRVIMVDKDLNEIKVLQLAFPEAHILICHFHVIKWMKETREKPEYGKISNEDAGQVD